MAALSELYTVPSEHLDFRDTIREIARERIAPRAAEIDEQSAYPHDLRKLLAEQDILGLPFEVEYGGTGTGTLMLNMFDGVRVPASNVIGEVNQGFKVAMSTLDRSRLMMRDAKITQIYEGPNKIQRLVIARTLR